MIRGPSRNVESRGLTPRVTGRPRDSRDRHGRARRVSSRSHSGRRIALVHGIAERLLCLMAERDIAVAELASAVGICVGAVFAHAAGRATPGIWTLLAYAEAMNCQLVDFLPEDEVRR